MHEPSVSHSRPRLSCRRGTLNPLNAASDRQWPNEDGCSRSPGLQPLHLIRLQPTPMVLLEADRCKVEDQVDPS